MILRKELPLEIKDFFGKIGIKEKDILLATNSDLDLEGNYKTQWLVLTPTRLINVGLEETLVWIVKEFSIDEFTSARVDGRVGTAFLEVEKDGKFYEVIRFSTALSWKFRRFAGKINDLIIGHDILFNSESQDEKEHSQKWGESWPTNRVSPKHLKKGGLFFRILKLIKPHQKEGLILFLLLLTSIGLDLVPPGLIKIIIDNIFGNMPFPNWFLPFMHWFPADNKLHYLLILVFGLGLIQLLRRVIYLITGRLTTKTATQVAFDLRCSLFKKLQELSISFYDRNQVEELITKTTHAVDKIQKLFSQLTSVFLPKILLLISIGILLLTINLRLAVYTLIPVSLVIISTCIHWYYLRPDHRIYRNNRSKLSKFLYTSLSKLQIIKAFGQEERETRELEYYNDQLRKSRIKIDHASSTFYPIITCAFGLAFLIVLYLGGKDLLHGDLTLGTLIAFAIYVRIFYGSLTQLINISPWFDYATAVQTLLEILDSEPEIKESKQALDFEFTGAISFKEVTFGYDKNFPVLNNLNLTIKPGEMVGIVGASGSGKSTIINLLCRFYDPDLGKVMIDNVDLSEISPACLHRQIIPVLQEPFLFRGSIAENIAFGRPDASFKEIISAAKAANAHDFIINLPNGYDTRLDEHGSSLATGEKQCISIARALLCNPKILILDQAASSVDTENKKAIQEALAILTQGKTTIVITDQLSTLRNAERIFVIDDGMIQAIGTHQELSTLNGLYKRLVRSQL